MTTSAKAIDAIDDASAALRRGWTWTETVSDGVHIDGPGWVDDWDAFEASIADEDGDDIAADARCAGEAIQDALETAIERMARAREYMARGDIRGAKSAVRSAIKAAAGDDDVPPYEDELRDALRAVRVLTD